ncbi:MAG TPA: mechanosensitive ion channel domain-containing protein [Pyrinomonadaceae bacterium]|nr:mechanosensitive ion channel domain-containing protein [Pyrinomonadaceae bacterium]
MLKLIMLNQLVLIFPELLIRFNSVLQKEYTFGKLTVSLSGLIIGSLVIVVSVALSRFVSTLIQRRISTKRHIDPGLRYTISRLIKYLILVLGILVALKQALGADLTSIAVVFTALSVGIGFGLQYLAADIAAGFILLFERPIRVGDRITIESDEGDVQSINLRTTVVMTNDRIAIIVPNSKLVSQRVVNWSYGDPRARVSIPVGVAYNSDIGLVTNTLVEAAKGVQYVLEDPAPTAQFLKFGDSSLDFRLLVWTGEPRRHVQIRSDINYRIANLFRERGIKIPFTSQEFVLKPTEQLERSLLGSDDGPTAHRPD